MKLPNAHLAVAPPEKITAYLLNTAHPDNGGKAASFSCFCFKAEEPHRLIQALLTHASDTDATLALVGYAGSTKYILTGTIDTPLGRSPKIRSIWVLEMNPTVPRFVTAYPAK